MLGKTIGIPKGKVHERICRPYHNFAGILPQGQGLNIELIDGKLRWVIYHVHRWEDHKFYWMPVGFTTKLSGAIRDITLSFMSIFIQCNGLTRFSRCEEYEYLLESSSDSICHNGYEEEEKAALEILLESYFNGEISGFLDEVYDHKPSDSAHITKLLNDYIPSGRQEAELIECLREGLPFISGGSIMAYDYDPDDEALPEDFEDFPPVSLDRMIRYVYDLDDFISNEMEYLVNQYLQGTYAVRPVSCMILHTDSNLFVPGDYPERFSQWFLKMVNLAIEITEKNNDE